MADKRWRGALFDAFVALFLAAIVSSVSVFAATTLARWARFVLARLGVV